MNRFFSAIYILFLTSFLCISCAEHAVISTVPQEKKISLRFFIQETRGLSEIAKQLYAQAMTYDEPMKLDQASPIAQKIAFDNVLSFGLCGEAALLLEKHHHLRKKHPIGRALWSVWKKNVGSFALDKEESHYISPEKVFFIAKEFAIQARNWKFLKSYLLKLKTDHEIRKIVFPFLYDSEFFDGILYNHAEDVIIRAGFFIDVKKLLDDDINQ